ncbi:hypothetical protein SAMN05216312_103229 [Cohnella sp. OV330]|uniref:hypothetical protein n=1 Tax=Cohnella sp. OV330 TaxID=1855288 RepID=UPI0008F4355E|nr:hypothetical protein [Cohnella sp. OV330]SFB05154.1 hypothetical protein SAMN05216312_103229 [Cohnella sp. OV330]
MNESVVQAAAIIGAAIALLIAVFHVLLLAGLPLGAYSWGGKYTGVLPPRVRWASLPSAIVLILIALMLLIYSDVIPTRTGKGAIILIWVVTAFFGLNTLGNLASKSKREKAVMTPAAGVAFLCCLIVAIWGGS